MALTWLWLAPALVAALVWLLPARAARAVALGASLGILAYGLFLIVPFQREAGEHARPDVWKGLRLLSGHVDETRAFGRPFETALDGVRLKGIVDGVEVVRGFTPKDAFFGIHYLVGVDSLSLALCWLTALLLLLCVVYSWSEDRPPSYWSAFFALESALMGVFTAQNLFYFYVFWDLALIPMFFIIGVWGSEGRRHAALKFVLYTFFGSLFLLIGTVALPVLHQRLTGVWTWDIPVLAATPAGAAPAAKWIFAAMALGFAVKVPVFPLHSWLPDAHTEAPAAGSVMLAGVMLKMGVYGFFHVLVPVFPEISRQALPYLGALGVVSILYGALCAMAQTDLKRLVAFTSVSHLGFCMAGLFSLTAAGTAGSALQMINHGLSTGGLFLLVGMIYGRAHRRGLGDFGGLAKTAPWLAFFFAFVLLSSIGLPGLNGFVGEFLALAGLAKVSTRLAALALLGTVLAAAYGLPAYLKVFWAPAGPGSVSERVADLDRRERLLLGSLAALILALGVYPAPALRFLRLATSGLVLR